MRFHPKPFNSILVVHPLMAEVHIIGELKKAIDFKESTLFCKWSFITGSSWKVIQGETEGQTITSSDILGEPVSRFSHPLDVHFATRSVQGWPKLVVQVYSVGSFNSVDPIGYGFVNIPTSPGEHRIEINTWKLTPPSFWEKIQKVIWGTPGNFTVADNCDLIYAGTERYKLETESSGKVVKF
uniref:B9 domain-containing protein 2 n=1 Tax=Megaselia scalaris TaxID=36166 RepID=T1GQX1_MEGSC